MWHLTRSSKSYIMCNKYIIFRVWANKFLIPTKIILMRMSYTCSPCKKLVTFIMSKSWAVNAKAIFEKARNDIYQKITTPEGGLPQFPYVLVKFLYELKNIPFRNFNFLDFLNTYQNNKCKCLVVGNLVRLFFDQCYFWPSQRWLLHLQISFCSL